MRKLLFLLSSPFFLFSEVKYELSYDRDLSPSVGSDLLISTHQLLENGENLLLSKSLLEEVSIRAALVRFAEISFIWFPLSGFEQVIQHEVFGHGYRARCLSNFKVHSYQLDAPAPYGDGGGATFFSMKDSAKVGDFQAVTIAGLEAQEILVQNIKMNWVKEKAVPAKQPFLYDLGRFSSLSYTLSELRVDVATPEETKDYNEHDAMFSGSDVVSYLAVLNAMYPDQKLTDQKLLFRLLINLIDPFFFYETKATWAYILFAEKSASLPMLQIGEVSYLGHPSVFLAPYGLEYVWENFLRYKEQPFYFYLKGAKGGSYGAGFLGEDLFSKGLYSLGCKADIWLQPNFLAPINVTNLKRLSLSHPSEEELAENNAQRALLSKKKLGASFSLLAKRRFSEESSRSLFLQLGFKTKGYVPGEILKSSLIARVGMSFLF